MVEANGDEKDGNGDCAVENKMDMCIDDVYTCECGVRKDFSLVVAAKWVTVNDHH